MIETVNLTESALQAGRYLGSVTLDVEGYYEAFYIAYTDSGHTTESEMVGRSSEAITMRVSSDVFGSGGGKQTSTIIDTKTIAEDVAKYLMTHLDVWKILLKNGKTAEDELIGKSEFNVVKDKVKTEFNLNELRPKDYSQEFIKVLSKISTLIDSITSLEQKPIRDEELCAQIDSLQNQITSLKDLEICLSNHDRSLENYENKFQTYDKNLSTQFNTFIDKLTSLNKDINSSVGVLNDLKDINNGVRSMERIEKLREIVVEVKDFIKKNQQLLYNLDQLQLDRFNNLAKLLSKGVPIRKV